MSFNSFYKRAAFAIPCHPSRILIEAVIDSNSKCARAALKRHANPNATDMSGRSALALALERIGMYSSHGRFNCIKRSASYEIFAILLKEGANPDSLFDPAWPKTGRILHEAIRLNEPAIVRDLYRHNVKVDRNDSSLLYCALESESPDMLKLMHESGVRGTSADYSNLLQKTLRRQLQLASQKTGAGTMENQEMARLLRGIAGFGQEEICTAMDHAVAVFQDRRISGKTPPQTAQMSIRQPL